MNPVIILQARTSSNRLPAKVLLPVGGMPLVVLAAKRAGNTGRHVVVATSREKSDDFLSKTLINNSVDVFRGDLKNTLARFTSCLKGRSDSEIVVRLTGDNPFPDGLLIDSVCEEFERLHLNYLCLNGKNSGVPHGVSVEVTRVACLREALKMTHDEYDVEHVTPFVRRKYGVYYSKIYAHYGMGDYRCTVDTFYDYLTVTDVFESVKDPVNVELKELLQLLRGAYAQPRHPGQGKRIVLEAERSSLSSGIENNDGKLSTIDFSKILESAIFSGVEYVYAVLPHRDSDNVLGDVLNVSLRERVRLVAGFDFFCFFDQAAAVDYIRSQVDARVMRLCHSLKQSRLDILMLCRESFIHDNNGEIWKRIRELRDEGVIERLGVFVHTPEELSRVLKEIEVTYIQLPSDSLEWKWSGIIEETMKEREKRALIIHARSGSNKRFPGRRIENYRPSHPKEVVDHQDCNEDNWQPNRVNRTIEHWLNGAVSQPWIDALVIGMEDYQWISSKLSQLDSSDQCN